MALIYKTRFPELGYWKVEEGCWSVVDITDPNRPAQVGQKYPTKATLLANLESYASDYGCELARPQVPNIANMTWEQLAGIVSSIRDEVKRRNPIGVNLYTPYLHAAEVALLEIGAGEKDNPTCD